MRNSATWITPSVGLLTLIGCGHGPRHVTDPDPADKIPAISAATRQGDRTSISQLVVDLDSDDSAVRFYSINGLRSFTGQDLGYRYYDEAEQRKPAIDRWKKWLASHPVNEK